MSYLFPLFLLLLRLLSARELLFSTLVLRHGARERYTPNITTKCLKNLINTGMRQVYIAGRFYGHRYIFEHKLLPVNFSAPTVYIRSTDLSRAINTATLLFTGMYHHVNNQGNPCVNENVLPFKTSVKCKTSGVFTTPTVHIIQRKEDNLLDSYKPVVCSAMKKNKKRRWLSDKIMDMEEHGVGTLWKDVSSSKLQVQSVEDALADNTAIIKLTTHNLLNQIIDYAKLGLRRRGLAIYNETENEIMERITRRDPAFVQFNTWRDSTKNRKELLPLVVYSAHDTLLMALVNAVGVRLEKRVPVSSVFAVELFLEGDTPLIEIYLNNQRLSLPNCKEKCKLEDFIEVVKTHGSFSSEEEYHNKCKIDL